MNNKTLGTKFEKDFARFLANQGYWVAPFPRKGTHKLSTAEI